MPFVTVSPFDLVCFLININRVTFTPTSSANFLFDAQVCAVSEAPAVTASDYSWVLDKWECSVVLMFNENYFFFRALV